MLFYFRCLQLWHKTISMAVIFAFSHPWDYFIQAFYTPGSLVESQDVESNWRLLLLTHYFRLSVSLQFPRFLNSLHFFYTQGSLVKGQVLDQRGIQLVFSPKDFSFFLTNCRVICIEGMVVDEAKKTSFFSQFVFSQSTPLPTVTHFTPALFLLIQKGRSSSNLESLQFYVRVTWRQ